MSARTIIFHSLDHARAALDASAGGAPFTLQTAPGAALYAGVSYLKALVDQAGAQHAVIDCGKDSGIVLAALRTGWKRVMFSGPDDVFAKLADIAEQQDARVLRPDMGGSTLDLLDTPDPAAACRRYFDDD